MSKTILITGVAGFLGSHLADAYLEKGFFVLGVDNFSTGSYDNIAHLEQNVSFQFIQCDIVDPLPKQVLSMKYDIIANLACPASPPHYQRLAIETLQVNSKGTLKMLNLAANNKARFFHASTSEVYGDPVVHPQPESYNGSVNCYGPRSMYDEGKRYSEALIYSHRKKYGTNTCVARFFNTYGPRMAPDDGRVVSNFIVQALQGKPLTVYGGYQTRSFCYVDDLIKAIILLIDSSESEPINLGNPSEFMINELAYMILDKTSSGSTMNLSKVPVDDPLQRKPDISKAFEKLGWQPRTSVDEGLDKTIKYFSDNLGLLVNNNSV